ncbi:hypothetical protein B0H13DRAFT_2276497 [Mycena leptocephala]|nr:hypothetical protein B0H13DRAFT_2276497 [Mycena leptocephala]
MVLRVYTPPDFLHTAALFSAAPTRKPLRFLQAALEEAHISVSSEGEDIIVEPRTATMLKCTQKTRFTLGGNTEHLRNAINGIAHFNYILDLTNDADHIAGLALEMHRLKGMLPRRLPDGSGNIVKDGEVRFKAEEGAMYGFTIRHTSPEGLFPYLFSFNPRNYTIKKWYSPERPSAQAPLPSAGTMTIGMGDEHAFMFMLDPGEVSYSWFLKLFVAREYVDLDWIEQPFSPFDTHYVGGRDGPRDMEFENHITTWDELTVSLTMTAQGQ